MTSETMIDATAQRLLETEAAIREQRRYLEDLTDPGLRAIAARTLATLEDMMLIMTRTQQLVTEMRSTPAVEVAPRPRKM